ncbi:MAG: prepilin-type N-terminal cleavage/methylation domain-containing protein [bacterium]|nr:prepilin-type N-terminal cleavage/methylation domain-containing protein [bacterium]
MNHFRKSLLKKPPGMSLSEVLIAVAILSMAAAIALPELSNIRRRVALRTASSRITNFLIFCRASAIMHGRSTAAVFEQIGDSRWRLSIAVDGDGDGVRSHDLQTHIDVITDVYRELECSPVEVGFLKGHRLPDPSGRGTLGGNLDDPVRGGVSDIITFTPEGNARSGSIYLFDQHSSMRVIRIYGVSGRVRTLEWHLGERKWKRVTW